MDDKQIVELYFKRNESAISETAKKYGRYCHHISFGILGNDEDAKECVNDTYLNAWNAIPPHCPKLLSAFLGKITRNLSLNQYEHQNALKRGGKQVALALHELDECIPSKENTEHIVEQITLTKALNNFLASLTSENRRIFIKRYWYFCPVKDISKEYGMKESNVKMKLKRLRESLKDYLEKEGIYL